MKDASLPYFLTNEEWFTINQEGDGNFYRLTEKAPEDARRSYDEFYGPASIDGLSDLLEVNDGEVAFFS